MVSQLLILQETIVVTMAVGLTCEVVLTSWVVVLTGRVDLTILIILERGRGLVHSKRPRGPMRTLRLLILRPRGPKGVRRLVCRPRGPTNISFLFPRPPIFQGPEVEVLMVRSIGVINCGGKRHVSDGKRDVGVKRVA